MGQDVPEDDFEAMIAKMASGEVAWTPDKSEDIAGPGVTAEVRSADDAEVGSNNGSNTDVTPEQEKQIERIGAFDVDAGLADVAELSKAATPDDDPEFLKGLLDADMAKQHVAQHAISSVTVIPIDDPKNPGWVVENLVITTKTAEELFLEDDLDAVYKRIGYECDKLTLEQQCEVMDKVQLHLAFVQREYATRLAHLHKTIKAKKLTAAQAKGYTDDVATKPASAAHAREKQVKRTTPAAPPKVAKIPQETKKNIDALLAADYSVKEVAAMYHAKDNLTPIIAEYLKSKEKSK